MAILSKIRERSLFLIAIIGLALFAFVLNPSKIFNGSKVDDIGEINGETISRQEFATALDAYKQQVGNRFSEMQAAKTVWDRLVREKIYQKQLEDAGVIVGEEDVWSEIIKTNPVSGNPVFKNEAGLFDEAKFKQFLKDTQENDPKLWSAWSRFMNQIRDNTARSTYNNLITAGLGASLKEGEDKYINENTKINAKYVYIPYSSVSNDKVSVSKEEVEAYIKAHPNEYKVEKSRDLSYVKFDIKPTAEDENLLKQEVAKLINDRKEYSSVTKGEVTVKGLKNTDNLEEFFTENASDLPLRKGFLFKNQISKEIADKVFAAKEGDVVGPYKEKGFIKLSKVVAFSKIPDSAKARHILIPFIGSRAATEDTKLTEQAAKKLADSIVKVVKKKRSKFAELAKKLSADKSNASKGGELNWFTYNRMVPEFRDYVFNHKKGDVGVVKTTYGYHIVEVQDQKNEQPVVKLATFARKITPSEKTENQVFQEAEKFALEVSKEKKFFDVARDHKYKPKPVSGLKVLDDNVPGLGSQRQIVTWAFNKDTKVGDYKRFDVDNGYVVAFLSAKIKEGLAPARSVSNKIKLILRKKKKAAIIKKQMKGETLEEVKKATGDIIRTVSGVTFKSPTISGIGYEPNVVGAMLYAKENKLYKGIEGSKGVFAFKVTKKEAPTALPNYDFVRKQLAKNRKNKTNQIYEAIKKASDIEDNRPAYFGIQ